MDTIRVLFVGETYTGVHTYVRGSDYVTLPDYSDVKGAGFCDALNRGGDIRAELMPSQEVLERFPLSMEALSAYDVVVISDVGSNTFLKNPKADGRRFPNRLELLRRFVEEGGGLMMCGGYFGFSGVHNTARYGMTPLAAALPVEISNYDDRIECPEGACPRVLMPEHPVFDGVLGAWPAFCGYNRVAAKQDSQVLADVCGDPFIVTAPYGEGRTLAFTSDCTPDWATQAFLDWDGSGRFFQNAVRWLAGRL